MAGSVTISEVRFGSVKKTSYAWTSDASGDVSGGATPLISGEIVRIVTDPDGSSAPTANYDILLKDEDSVDLAQGLLANRHTSNVEDVFPRAEQTVGSTTALLPIITHSLLDCVVSNAGNAKKGEVHVYWR